MKNSQKRNQKTSKYIKIAVLCVSFIVIICMMFLIYNDMKDKKHHTADDSADNKEYSSIEVDGKDYNYNRQAKQDNADTCIVEGYND